MVTRQLHNIKHLVELKSSNAALLFGTATLHSPISWALDGLDAKESTFFTHENSLEDTWLPTNCEDHKTSRHNNYSTRKCLSFPLQLEAQSQPKTEENRHPGQEDYSGKRPLQEQVKGGTWEQLSHLAPFSKIQVLLVLDTVRQAQLNKMSYPLQSRGVSTWKQHTLERLILPH